MSRSETLAALLDAPEVLTEGHGLCCWHTWRPLRHHTGLAVLPWRGSALAALAAGVPVVTATEALKRGFHEAVVLVGKVREAAINDCLQAWSGLPPGGRLLVVGGNEVGIRSTVGHLQRRLATAGTIRINRDRARVVVFIRDDAPAPPLIPPPEPILDGEVTLTSAWGIFSASGLDAGSARLIAHLDHETPPRRILDLGAGIGVLGLAALRRWPDAQGLLLEADRRAWACIPDNARRCACAERCDSRWWDATETVGDTGFDCALINPPCHHRDTPAFDLSVAGALFSRAAEALTDDGRILVVANRQLAHERPLAQLFAVVERLTVAEGFKILRCTQPRRSRS